MSSVYRVCGNHSTLFFFFDDLVEC